MSTLLKFRKELRIWLYIGIVWIGFTGITFILGIPVLNLGSFWITGVLSQIVIYRILMAIIKLEKISLSKKQMMACLMLCGGLVAIYGLSILFKKGIYTWDNTMYYSMMNNLIVQFRYSVAAGFSEWWISGLVFDYGQFLQIFIYPFFALTNGRIKAYILSYCLGIVIPVVFSLYVWFLILLKKVDKAVYSNIFVRVIGLIVLLFFPLLHGAAINGQPDIAGLIFVGMILSLTTDYHFEKRDIKRWCILFGATILLIITRRWYLFFCVAYYFMYAITILLYPLMQKDYNRFKIRFKNLFIFGMTSVVCAVVLLHKMILRILGDRYSTSYAAWNRGGLPYEIVNQIQFTGVLIFLIAVIGIVFGLCSAKIRDNTIILIGTYFVELVLFTRIQNAGIHQSLIFVPVYLYGMFLFCMKLSQRKRKGTLLVAGAVIASFINCAVFNFENTMGDTILSKVNIYPERRTDLEQIDQVVEFIRKEVPFGETLMVMAGSNKYDCATFINYPVPEANKDIIAANNYYAASEGFPEEFFTCSYIMDIENITQREAIVSEGVLQCLKDAFYGTDSIFEKFEQIGTFDLEDGSIATIYKRIMPVDDNEVTSMLQSFKEYCDTYPEMFYEKIISFGENDETK